MFCGGGRSGHKEFQFWLIGLPSLAVRSRILELSCGPVFFTAQQLFCYCCGAAILLKSRLLFFSAQV